MRLIQRGDFSSKIGFRDIIYSSEIILLHNVNINNEILGPILLIKED